MSTTEIKSNGVTIGHISVNLGPVAMKAEGSTIPPAPPPPAPPSIGRKVMRAVTVVLTADRIAQAAEHWWPTIKELGKEIGNLFRGPPRSTPA